MKLYTGSGDRGMTSLFSGQRVKKNYDRVKAYGDVDELNSFLGTLAAALPSNNTRIAEEIQRIQSDLFHVGAWLATTPDSPSLTALKKISEENVEFLETAIERIEQQLPPLKGFILPGGHISAGLAHVARTVCRRAERNVFNLHGDYSGGEVIKQFQQVVAFLNRLSDYLFAIARHCNQIVEVPDIIWQK